MLQLVICSASFPCPPDEIQFLTMYSTFHVCFCCIIFRHCTFWYFKWLNWDFCLDVLWWSCKWWFVFCLGEQDFVFEKWIVYASLHCRYHLQHSMGDVWNILIVHKRSSEVKVAHVLPEVKVANVLPEVKVNGVI